MTVVYAPDQGERARVAFGVSRHVGSAVIRNRLRRVLRDELAHVELRPGAYLVRVSDRAATVGSSELRSSLRAAVAAAVGAKRP